MANKLKEGQKFNKLTFIDYAQKFTKDKHLIGLFKCDCGEMTEKPISRVVNGYVKTCGNKIHFKGMNTKHGMRNTPEYVAWQSIKSRVYYKKNKDFPKYSKLGIDKNLADDFTEFLNEVGKKPGIDYSIDRINNTKGYFKGNLKWSTRSEQQSNKSTSVIVFINGMKFKSEPEAAKHFQVTVSTIRKWCRGDYDKRRDKYNKPKLNCFYELHYKK